MAFFNPLGALSAGAGGFVQGQRDYTKDAEAKLALQQQQFDMMGLQALGRAFQPDQGPQPPNPGQASMPAQAPMAGPPMPPPGGAGSAPNIAQMKMAALGGLQPAPGGLPVPGMGPPPAVTAQGPPTPVGGPAPPPPDGRGNASTRSADAGDAHCGQEPQFAAAGDDRGA